MAQSIYLYIHHTKYVCIWRFTPFSSLKYKIFNIYCEWYLEFTSDERVRTQNSSFPPKHEFRFFYGKRIIPNINIQANRRIYWKSPNNSQTIAVDRVWSSVSTYIQWSLCLTFFLFILLFVMCNCFGMKFASIEKMKNNV